MVALLAFAIYFDGGNNYTASANRKAIRQMNRPLQEHFAFLKRSGIGIKPFKLHVFLWLPLWVLNVVMSIVFNTKMGGDRYQQS